MGQASIFNDVIGPVMRGPSSSHAAAAARIGQLIRMSVDKPIVRVTVGFDIRGSLVATHEGQGSDMGLICGLLGIPLDDSRVDSYAELARQEGMQIQFEVKDYQAEHPNYYHITIQTAADEIHIWEAVSVGGGMIQIQKIDGFDLCICGDYYELIIIAPMSQTDKIKHKLILSEAHQDTIFESDHDGKTLINVKYVQPIMSSLLRELEQTEGVQFISILEPILPILTKASNQVPFSTAKDLVCYAKSCNYDMWQLAALYESKRGDISEREVFQTMYHLLSIIKECIEQGVHGTSYDNRILGPQAYLLDQPQIQGALVPSELVNKVIRNITAIMEVKSSMGTIVACPTAGSCGCLPGTITGVAEVLGADEETEVKSLLVAGLIGVFISEQATFSAEVAGCQAECGAGSAMAAAGLVQMMGGTVEQCIDAASLALQNVTGLACDPVANRVEVPCLGKNILGGMNAISSANMILAGFDKVIPLDETIRAMYDIGTKLPRELRCTWGGLGKTKTAQKIDTNLNETGNVRGTLGSVSG